MRSKIRIVQVIALFMLLTAACRPQTNTDITPTNVVATDSSIEEETVISTEEESAGCKRIVYSYAVLGRNHFQGSIYSVCTDGSDLLRLSQDNFDNTRPTWSPDGREIAFLSRHVDIKQLYLMDADGGNIRQITFGSNSVDNVWFWLPDGNRIAMLITTEDGQRYWQTVDVLTQEMFPLTDWSDDIFFQSPIFSHDGARLAYLIWSEEVEGAGRRASIHIQNIDGSNDYVLISDIWTRNRPVWSPDDSQIAFLIDLAGNDDQFALYIVNTDGSSPQRVSSSVFSQPVALTWSSNGESLVIYDNESLYILDIKTGAIINLLTVEFPNHVAGFSWQP